MSADAPSKPAAEIVGDSREPFELDIKRFYMPGIVLRATCPQCGAKYEKDFTGEPLRNPSANKVMQHNCCCECEHEWTVPLRLTVKLEVVSAESEGKKS